jgi:hypothetical protein
MKLPLLLAFAFTIFVYREARFAGTEPGTDQIAMARWIQDVRAADHVLPRRQAGERWYHALVRDDASSLHQLTSRLYNQPAMLAMAVPFAATYLYTSVVSDSYAHQVRVGILVSTLVVPILGVAIHPLAGVVAAVSLYLSYFSPWSAHGFGLLSLCLSLLWMARALERDDPREAGMAALFAVLSHWTNWFLVPPALLLNLIRNRRFPLYFAWLAAFLAPAFLVMYGLALFAKTPFFEAAYFAPTSASVLVHRAKLWLDLGVRSFSWPGLLLCLVGLFGSGRPLGLFRAALVAHFLVWCFLPGFTWNGSGTYWRTFPYAVVLLCAGAGGAWKLRGTLAKTSVALGLIALFLAQRDDRSLPPILRYYQGEAGRLEATVKRIEQTLPADYALSSWDYESQNRFSVMRDPARGRAHFLPALKPLSTRARDGSLGWYLSERAPDFSTSRPIFLLSEEGVSDHELETVLQSLLPPGQRVKLLTVASALEGLGKPQRLVKITRNSSDFQLKY